MAPKGILIIIGGAVHKGSFTESDFEDDVKKNLNYFEVGILNRILTESKNKGESRIEIITTASKIPAQVGREYKRAFEYLGSRNVDVLSIENREEANVEATITRLKEADIVMVTGGDQLRLSSLLGGTLFHDLLLEKYQNDHFVYAGTSAGAAAASSSMIYQGSSSEALLKGEIKITQGLGFIDGIIVDTHFVQRGRIGRLFQAVASNPRVLGIGLGEDTGLLIKDNNSMEAIGSGLVILVDGRSIKDTSLTSVQMGEPISIDNMVVHVMCMYDHYDLKRKHLNLHKTETFEKKKV